MNNRPVQKLDDVTLELNRLYAQKARLQYQIKQTAKRDRLKRTRTLIQLGGLVSKSGLMDVCDIAEGDDLRFDIQNLDKAAILLGFLHENLHHLLKEGSLPEALRGTYLKTGKRLLKGGVK